jgi:hypothetical protein
MADMLKFFSRTHQPDDEDHLTIAMMCGDYAASCEATMRDQTLSPRIKVQEMLARAETIARHQGQFGWADHCRAQLRAVLKHDRHSVEQAGYAKQALRALGEGL